MKLTLVIFALMVIFTLQVLGATTANTTSDLTSSTTESKGDEDTEPKVNTSIQSVSSSIETISSSMPPGKVLVTTNTTKNQLGSKSSIAATSTPNSTVGNTSTQEIGGGGGADGVSSSYYLFVLTVIGACVLNVPEV